MARDDAQPDRPWTAALRNAIRAAGEAGHSYRAIQQMTGVSHAELHRIMLKHRAGTRQTAERVAEAIDMLAKKQRESAANCEREARSLRKALKAGAGE